MAAETVADAGVAGEVAEAGEPAAEAGRADDTDTAADDDAVDVRLGPPGALALPEVTGVGVALTGVLLAAAAGAVPAVLGAPVLGGGPEADDDGDGDGDGDGDDATGSGMTGAHSPTG